MTSRTLPYRFTRDRLHEEYIKLAQGLKPGEEIVFSGEVPEGLVNFSTTESSGGQILFMGLLWTQKTGCPVLTIIKKEKK